MHNPSMVRDPALQRMRWNRAKGKVAAEVLRKEKVMVVSRGIPRLELLVLARVCRATP